jgi:hypothetical protein
MSTKTEKLLIAALSILLGIAMGAAWALSEIPDQKVESYGDTCIPIYYSGLECCKK